MVASGAAWPADTSAPVVTTERPMRPPMGALTCVNRRLISALATAARARSVAAVAAAAADCATASCLVPVTHSTIQAGIDDSSCPIVWVMPGIYGENLVIARDVEVHATDLGGVVVDGGGVDRVLLQMGETVRLVGLTLQHGASDGAGGAVSNVGTLVLEQVRVLDERVSELGRHL